MWLSSWMGVYVFLTTSVKYKRRSGRTRTLARPINHGSISTEPTFLLLEQAEMTPTLAPFKVMDSNGGQSNNRSVEYRVILRSRSSSQTIDQPPSPFNVPRDKRQNLLHQGHQAYCLGLQYLWVQHQSHQPLRRRSARWRHPRPDHLFPLKHRRHCHWR